MKIFVFGNTMVANDSLAPRLMAPLIKALPDIDFIHADPTDQWWEGVSSPIIIDSVVGLTDIQIFDSLSSFENPHIRITPHDYDLYMDLSFLVKLKKIEGFTLIGIPPGSSKDSCVSTLVSIIKKLNRS